MNIQSKIWTEADIPEPSESVSIPIGLIGVVSFYLHITGVLDFVDQKKTKGIQLSKIVIAMCTHILCGNNSMSKCAEWLNNPDVRKEIGLDSTISQKTINRAVKEIGKMSDEIIMKLWEGLNSIYHFENTDVNIDGSAVVVNGPKAELGAIGYPRDYKDQSRKHVEFITAELQKSRIPFFIRAYPGNMSDPKQYTDALPSIFSMIRAGSWIIMDNGGASGEILDSIVKSGNKYLTRVKINRSDEERIKANNDKWEYVEDNVFCLSHSFDSSGRTTYLFFTLDNWMRSFNAAERTVKRMISAIRSYKDGKFKPSDFVTVKKNVLAEVEVKVSAQTHFDYDDEDEFYKLIMEVMGVRSGIFKLESSEQLTPREALNKYRARTTVEHLIHSLKRVTGIKPLRVWEELSIRGSMMLALLSETAIAMARYELKPQKNKKKNESNESDSSENDSRPSTESMVWSLSHLTLTREIVDGERKKAIISNWDHISTEVFANIRRRMLGDPPITA